MSLHKPQRPEWTCGDCHQPWPTISCQVWLEAMYLDAHNELFLAMQDQAALAKKDRPDDAELQDRILKWLE
jgi:hypothetical protein